jgi:hypothetical protein
MEYHAEARLSDAPLAVLALLILLAELLGHVAARRRGARTAARDELASRRTGVVCRVELPAAALARGAVAGVAAMKRVCGRAARCVRARHALGRRLREGCAARVGSEVARSHVARRDRIAAAVGARASALEAHLASARRALVLPRPARSAVLRLLAAALQVARRALALARRARARSDARLMRATYRRHPPPGCAARLLRRGARALRLAGRADSLARSGAAAHEARLVGACLRRPPGPRRAAGRNAVVRALSRARRAGPLARSGGAA